MDDIDELAIEELKNSCCLNPKRSEKGIMHNGEELRLDAQTYQFFKYVVLYSTEQSLQYKKNDLLTDENFSEKTFQLMKESMGLADNDVRICKKKLNISIRDICNSPCTECQKLMLMKEKKDTLPMTFLIHLRNSLAHGRFNIINGLFIGMDCKPNHNEDKFLNPTAYIKIRLDKLNSCFDCLFPYEVKSYFREPDITNTFIVVMKELGYKLESLSLNIDETRAYHILSKNDVNFYFEIKKYNDYWIRRIIAERIHKRFKIQHENCIPVLIIYSSRLTNESKEYFFEKRMLVLDRRDLKIILSGSDRLYELYLKMYDKMINK